MPIILEIYLSLTDLALIAVAGPAVNYYGFDLACVTKIATFYILKFSRGISYFYMAKWNTY